MLETGAHYELQVTYSASFDPPEMGDTFHAFIALRRKRQFGPDDYVSEPIELEFVPNQVDHQPDSRPGHGGMAVINRDLSYSVPKAAIAHQSEVYGEIWLRSSGNLDDRGPVGSDSGLATTGFQVF